jgi:aldose 1-epimerase
MEKLTLGGPDFLVEIWSRGACVNDLRMPDRSGQVASVVLGYASQAHRQAGTAYLGEIVGPFANRIGAGGYLIDGQRHTPDLNDHQVATLHGGARGFSHQDWSVVHHDASLARLALDWDDPSRGFPGPIHAEVEYRLDGWSLHQRLTATTGAPTVISVVSHPYFNLSGTGAGIGDHELQVAAQAYLPVGADLIPLPGAPAPVAGTAVDFRAPALIGPALASPQRQIAALGGIDHALVLDGAGLRPVARLRHPASGRQVEFITDYPALQVYTGQMLDDQQVSHPAGAGTAYSGIAIETEEYPDAPRRADYPSVVLRPGQTWARQTTWRFSLA